MHYYVFKGRQSGGPETRKVMMMNYEEMSDFEINKQVAINRGGYQGHVEHMQHGVKEFDRASRGLLFTERDYCNNPSDAWPIINSIFWELVRADEFGVTEWAKRMRADDGSDKLRAAMIVFLMMQESK